MWMLSSLRWVNVKKNISIFREKNHILSNQFSPEKSCGSIQFFRDEKIMRLHAIFRIHLFIISFIIYLRVIHFRGLAA
jgi:hypothetical protein